MPPEVAARRVAPQPLWARPGRLCPGFVRLFPLPGDRLGPMLAHWWSSHDKTAEGEADVHRLGLRAPISVEGGGWILAGHMYRPCLRRRVPVRVEMWPALTDWTRVTMDPHANVAPTEHWFRDGHLSLERFVAQLEAALRLVPVSDQGAVGHP